MIRLSPCILAAAALAAFASLADAEPTAAPDAGPQAAPDVEIARQALRDGLWDVARSHASKAGGDEARLIVLESLAREDRWPDVLKTLEEWGFPSGEGFVCYRAAAHVKSGDFASARELLGGVKFADAGHSRTAALLRAEMELESGDPASALRVLKEDGGDGVDAAMLKADALAKTGDKKAAEAIWRETVANTNVPERALSAAAVKLGDVEVLRSVYAKVKAADVRRAVGFRLGVALLKSKDTFAEGVKLVRALVRDAPDAAGARDACLALAEAYLARSAWESAAQVYAEALETWPDIVKDHSFQEGRGWAFAKLEKHDDALAAFERAAELAEDPEAKAKALAAAGDVLSVLGRGDEAMTRYREVSQRYPGTKAAASIADLVRLHELESRGRTLYGEYRFADAQRVFEQVAREKPSRAPQMEYFGVLCLYGQGRDDDAAAKARAIASGGGPVDVRAAATLWLAKLSYNRGRWKDAGTLFAAYADLMPGSAVAPDALVWAARSAFADNDFQQVVAVIDTLLKRYPDSAAVAAGLLVRGEAHIELAHFDEAVQVLDRAALVAGISSAERLRAQLLKADAQFAMGADNPARYRAALETYRTILLGEDLSPTQKITLSFKVGKTLEKLKRIDEAIDQYYTQVVLAYRNGRERGLRYEDEAVADFSRAAFRLAEEFESRGRDYQAVRVLDLVVSSGVPAADEAARRIDRIQRKGNIL